MSAAYYNEIDPYAAQWLRNLIAAGHIASGEVDERSIVDVEPDDLRGFTQCHFFAGIGVWSYALRLAGWPDDRPVWTGSCPCQPFSAAGKGDEFADERHLWPAWFELIRERRPVAVFGEQVASGDALAWLDHVCADLEAEGYAVGAVDTCAAGFGAPHIRQRLYFVADAKAGTPAQNREQRSGEQRLLAGRGGLVALADTERWSAERHRLELGSEARGSKGEGDQRQRVRPESGHGGDAGELAEPVGNRQSARSGNERCTAGTRDGGHADGAIGLGVTQGDAKSIGLSRSIGAESSRRGDGGSAVPTEGASATNGFWRDADWIACRDGKARPTEPGTFPLVAGAPSRVGRLRAYGNCICAPQAAEFIRAAA